jgi:PLP dependent protein
MSDYEVKYHRKPHSVDLLAVSKGQAVEKILSAYQAGQTQFGESYLQEALIKIALLSDKNIEWHFIGTIQSNKTRHIAAHFSWAHCVNSMKIAKRLNDQRPAHLPPINICIEINISHEENKSGVKTEELNDLIYYCLGLPHVKLRGLMAIPAREKEFELQRKSFHHLYFLYENFCQQGIPFDTLSMGMSQDFEAAIAEGATIVRIGELLFGKRYA